MSDFADWPGESYPLGATWQGEGVNFAVFSEGATGVDLCLFDDTESHRASRVIRLPEYTDHVWHGFVPGLKPGQLYGFRAHGPYEPEKGLRYNGNKLLVDPYAKAIAGKIRWGDEVFAYTLGNPRGDLTRDYRDDAWGVPKSIVIDPAFDWGGDRHPGIPPHQSLIYEVHVKGFTKLCGEIPEKIRGTYAALGSDFAINYFKQLGVTAVELLPVHQHMSDKALIDRDLSNYWGYNTLGYFAPECSYSAAGVMGGQVAEFKQMVKNLHAAGIEVILDVVYNHTGEGNHLGPTLCFRGLDNRAYYRLVPEHPRYYMDYTGTGNTLNVMHPRVLQLIMDSLRYWVMEMHVDGFRFDLASALTREAAGVSKFSAFLDIIHQDPVLSRVKLIAEPWDVGEGGYQVGGFPVLWAEWNGKYRDTVRRFWKGDEGHAREMAFRLAGSPDLYKTSGKRPYASINFVTAHDGFTLNDLVSYQEKHNEANGEDNRDGDNHNNAWNCGEEGPSTDAAINTLRRRQRRNFYATLLLSQGVPMLCAGDEYGRSQRGNNNAYCQDNVLSWLRWEREAGEKQLFEYVQQLIALRQAHPVFRRPKFFLGRKIRGGDIKDIMWFNPQGSEMTNEEWRHAFIRCFGMLLSGEGMDVRGPRGEPIRDDTFLLLLNAHHEPLTFVMPAKNHGGWRLILDTRLEAGFVTENTVLSAGEQWELMERSLSLFRLQQQG
jgi:glycogen operon protein